MVTVLKLFHCSVTLEGKGKGIRRYKAVILQLLYVCIVLGFVVLWVFLLSFVHGLDQSKNNYTERLTVTIILEVLPFMLTQLL